MQRTPEGSAVARAGGEAGREKRVPQRTCVGCGTRRDQRAMLRVAAVPESGSGAGIGAERGICSVPGAAAMVDQLYKAPGLGAYLCRQVVCIENAWKRRALERALKLKNSVPASLRDDIMKVLSTTL